MLAAAQIRVETARLRNRIATMSGHAAVRQAGTVPWSPSVPERLTPNKRWPSATAFSG